MGLFSFFSGSSDKKNQVKNELEGFEPLYADLHSHLLPGIDDGAQDLNESLELLREFKALGFRKVVTTPHVLESHYNNTPEIIREKLQSLRTAASEAGITIEIEAGAEYFYDEAFIRMVEEGEELMTFGQNYLLFETPTLNEPISLKKTVKALHSRGINPILAHPERYTWISGNFEKAKELFSMGLLFQINVLSLIGLYDRPSQKAAEKLIENEMVQFLGSDCHKLKHIQGYKDAIATKHYKLALELPLQNRSL